MPGSEKPKPILVKRYALSRLYDAENRCYVSVEQLRGWAAEDLTFVVLDAETGADITRVLLT